LYDTVRGANNILFSDTAAGQDTATSNRLTAFDADGFTLGNGVAVNANGNAHVAWNWKAGGSASSNTNGTITSSVSANPSAGFSIVSYAGSGSAGTVGHGLSQIPDMIITKDRDGAFQWITWHKDLTNAFASDGAYVYLNTTNAQGTVSVWYDGTGISSSVYAWRSGNENVNQSGDNYISYCFHSVDGYSKVGSFLANGAADNAFIHLGFRAAMVIFKRSDSTGNWTIWDNERNTSNAVDKYLFANSSNAEGTDAQMDILSNGIKIRTSGYASGGTYIFIAFAETPFKFSNAR